MWNGTVQNGVIVLESPGSIPEGTRVNVVPAQDQSKSALGTSSLEQSIPSTPQMLLKHAGVTDQLPDDMARNHDHYLHGLPKR